MAKEIISARVQVPMIGKPEDYANLPIIKDGKAIGVVMSAVEERFQYTLRISLWQDIGLELWDGIPSAVIFG